jgi:general secretion pathway protein G
MSSPIPPPPQTPPSGQWAYPTDEKGEPKKSYVIWIVVGAAGCLGLLFVIGIFATILVPRIAGKVVEARRASVKHQLNELYARLLKYDVEHGRYPDSLEELALPNQPRDAWGHPIVYEPPTRGQRDPRIYSLGRDGQPGGTGEDADIHWGAEPAQRR